MRGLLLDIQALFLETAAQEEARVYEGLKQIAKSKTAIASLFDDKTFAQAAGVAGFRNVMAAIEQVLHDAIEEEFEATHGITMSQSASTFQEDLMKRMAAEAVANEIATKPNANPAGKTGLN